MMSLGFIERFVYVPSLLQACREQLSRTAHPWTDKLVVFL
jgi:hypothetical protein